MKKRVVTVSVILLGILLLLVFASCDSKGLSQPKEISPQKIQSDQSIVSPMKESSIEEDLAPSLEAESTEEKQPVTGIVQDESTDPEAKADQVISEEQASNCREDQKEEPSLKEEEKDNLPANDSSAEVNQNTTQQKPNAPELHVHDWYAVTEYIRHEVTGHYEEMLVTDAWDETVYSEYSKAICNGCGAYFETVNEICDHIMEAHQGNASYTSKKVQVDIIHHEAIYEDVWVIDEPAYSEEIILYYECDCGAQKSP